MRDPVHLQRSVDACGFEDGGNDVDDVVELVADAAGILDAVRPRNCDALARAAKMRRNLLGPFEGRVHGPGPAHGHVRISLVRTPDVVEFHLVRDRNVDAIECGHLVRRAVGRAFGAAAVVAADVDDERVVELAHSWIA